MKVTGSIPTCNVTAVTLKQMASLLMLVLWCSRRGTWNTIIFTEPQLQHEIVSHTTSCYPSKHLRANRERNQRSAESKEIFLKISSRPFFFFSFSSTHRISSMTQLTSGMNSQVPSSRHAMRETGSAVFIRRPCPSHPRKGGRRSNFQIWQDKIEAGSASGREEPLRPRVCNTITSW